MTREQKHALQAILDLAEARLRNPPLDPNVEHDLKEIVRLAETIGGGDLRRVRPPSTAGADGDDT